MATNSIEKSLNQAPLGIADLAADEPELEIEVALEGEDRKAWSWPRSKSRSPPTTTTWHAACPTKS